MNPSLILSSLFHTAASEDPDAPLEIYDLADLTPQCGRRGDSLKLFLSLQYYGVEYYERAVDQAFANADEFYAALESKPEIFKIVSEKPLPCLQVSTAVSMPLTPRSASTTTPRRASSTARS